MGIKVGINGFGRIGRIVSRACLQNCDLQLAAINDPAISIEYVSYLLKFDSTHGKFSGTITHNEDEIVINDHHIKVFHEKLPPSIPWHSAGVQYVVEASGMYTSQEKASGHLTSDGVKRVIVTAPSVDVPMIVLGVNDCNLSTEYKVISCASSTLYCLAPIIKVLQDNFGVEEGFLTSIHAMTPSLKPLDGLCLRGRHWRDHRSIHQNIIPASTGACKALGKILPQVKDKLSGLAFRVPIVNVSVLDLTIRLQTNTTLQEITKSVQQASITTLSNIIKVSNEESVSSDFIGETRSCIFDQDSSIQLKPDFFKLICWYENEYSYACRVVDTILFLENQICLEIPHKMTNVRHVISLRKHNVLQQTKCSKNEMVTACKCKPEVNSEIVSSLSQDSGVKIKSSPALFIRKQFSATNPTYKSTKTDELLKIWNNTSEKSKPSVKANTCAFFQSCTGFPQQIPKKDECDTQARLENVKREFTKMVSITEDLLKKTYSSQSNVRSISTDTIKCLKGLNLKAKDVYKDDEESYTKCENCSPVKDFGDCKSSVDLSNISQPLNHHCNNKDDAVSLVSNDKEKSEYSDCNSNITKYSKNLEDGTDSRRELNKSNENKDEDYLIKFDHETYHGKNVRSSENIEFKEHLTKTFTTLIDGLSQNRHVRCVWDDHKMGTINCAKKEKIKPRGNAKTVFFEKLLDSFEEKGNNTPEINNFENREDRIANKFNKCMLTTEKSNIKIIDEELRKRNIVLIDSSFVSETENELCNEENDNSADVIDEKFKDTRLSEQILEGLAYTSKTVKIISKDTLNCMTPENTVTTMSNVAFEHREDIYDKLDSASESNSNNSFEINEKKSQVIQITDLTNSLEDLARLDKICRIIEISDELSNKLFSALDDNHAHELKKKRWSFKDLCARIKLDEFCNKVFGGNAV